MLKAVKRLALDISPVRESRDYRLLFVGQIVSNLGTQAALVALPFQIFVLSHSAALVGLLGAFELGPMIVVSLVVGALADRLDRRLLLALAQLAVIAAAGALAAAAFTGQPPVIVVLILGGLLAGGSALDGVTRAAIIPNVLSPEQLGSGLALNFGIYQVTGIVGPAVGGLLIAATSLGATYLVDAASCLAMLAAAFAIAPQRPIGAEHPPILSSKSGPRLGDIESCTVAELTSAMTSVISGGIACMIGVGIIMLAFPQLAAYGTHDGPPVPASP